MKISASIVTYKEDVSTLKKTLDSFFSIEMQKEMVIVDNSPTNELKNLCNRYPLTYIYAKSNLGFSAGHNLAFSKLKNNSDIHLVLNPDIFFNGDEMKSFLIWLKQQKDISLSTTKVLFPDNSIQNVVRNIPTFSTFIKRKIDKNYDTIAIKNNSIDQIPFAHGCFFAFKTEVFNMLQGFDERFFMYMEDVDIWIRAKQYGKTVINTNYSIYHSWKKASSADPKLFLVHIVSIIKFFIKYYSSLKLIKDKQ